MDQRHCFQTLFVILIALFMTATMAPAQDSDGVKLVVPPEWSRTYTPEELAAIDKALWAGNFVREDLKFKKNYTKGHQCFPVVLDMLSDPLCIAPEMDKMVDGFNSLRAEYGSPLAEVTQSLGYFHGVTPEKIKSAFIKIKSKSNGANITEIDSLKSRLEQIALAEIDTGFSKDRRDFLRQYIPSNMAWHDIFESPFSAEQQSAWEEEIKDKPADYLYSMASEIDIEKLFSQYLSTLPDPRGLFTEVPSELWPREPLIIETKGGRIGIGTINDDKWEGDFTVLIEPGGNDHYVNCRLGAAFGTDNSRVGYFVDLGGNDFYDCGSINVNLGAAVLGIAAFYDLGQGNDRYVGGSCSLGAAMCGVATFYDDGGSDIYEGKVYTQGAAGFGIGVMVDRSIQEAPIIATDVETPDPINIGLFDNDSYSAWTNAQAFARTLGIAVCSNERGNEIYYAGGVYLHAPLFADRYQSFSQGFAIGERGIDYAGGIALIVDYSGNDRYLGDIYNQGVGYWYAAGLVYDVAGNDMYEMTQYGQGSGIHLAVGGLVDISGNDSYMMHSGLGTGGSHDFASSVLHDRGGNDQYFGNTSCNGGSLTNSAVVFIDRAGDDTYAGRLEGGVNFARPERGFISIGVLVDLGGKDDYLGIMKDGMLWDQTSVGVGWDVIPPPVPESEAAQPERGQLGENVPQPEIISYKGELTQEVFTELWGIATRWAVGDNRYIVPNAINRLIEFGPAILPYISEEFKNDRGGLAYDPFNKIFRALIEKDKKGVLEVIKTNLLHDDQVRRRVALSLISELKLTELEGDVASYLDDPDPLMQRRAIGVLGSLGSHIADERLIANLNPANSEPVIKVSLETLFKLQSANYSDIRVLLDYPYISVRETLIGLLIRNSSTYETYIKKEVEDYIQSMKEGTTPKITIRMLRSILKVLYSGLIAPDEPLAQAVSELLSHPDWGVRADAVKVVKHWKALEPQVMRDPALAEQYGNLRPLIWELRKKVHQLMKSETEPYVLFVGESKDEKEK